MLLLYVLFTVNSFFSLSPSVTTLFDLKRCRDIHAVADGAGYRAVVLMKAVDTLRGLPVSGAQLQKIGHVDPLDDEDVVLLLYLAPCL